MHYFDSIAHSHMPPQPQRNIAVTFRSASPTLETLSVGRAGRKIMSVFSLFGPATDINVEWGVDRDAAAENDFICRP